MSVPVLIALFHFVHVIQIVIEFRSAQSRRGKSQWLQVNSIGPHCVRVMVLRPPVVFEPRGPFPCIQTVGTDGAEKHTIPCRGKALNVCAPLTWYLLQLRSGHDASCCFKITVNLCLHWLKLITQGNLPDWRVHKNVCGGNKKALIC